MNRALLAFALAAALAWAPEAVAQDGLLFAFEGFGYQAPDFDPANYLALGEGYEVVGVVTRVGSWIAPGVDMTTHQYTLHLSGLTVVEREFRVPEQVLSVRFSNDARVLFYEDPIAGGTPASYGVDPPNATSPSTFTDGQLALGGEIDEIQALLRLCPGLRGISEQPGPLCSRQPSRLCVLPLRLVVLRIPQRAPRRQPTGGVRRPVRGGVRLSRRPGQDLDLGSDQEDLPVGSAGRLGCDPTLIARTCRRSSPKRLETGDFDFCLNPRDRGLYCALARGRAVGDHPKQQHDVPRSCAGRPAPPTHAGRGCETPHTRSRERTPQTAWPLSNARPSFGSARGGAR